MIEIVLHTTHQMITREKRRKIGTRKSRGRKQVARETGKADAFGISPHFLPTFDAGRRVLARLPQLDGPVGVIGVRAPRSRVIHHGARVEFHALVDEGEVATPFGSGQAVLPLVIDP